RMLSGVRLDGSQRGLAIPSVSVLAERGRGFRVRIKHWRDASFRYRPRTRQAGRTNDQHGRTDRGTGGLRPPDFPMLPEPVLRRACEYLRHGTLCWSITLDVATDQIIEPSWDLTRGGQMVSRILCAPGGKRAPGPAVACDEGETGDDRAFALVRWVADLAGLAQETPDRKGTR